MNAERQNNTRATSEGCYLRSNSTQSENLVANVRQTYHLLSQNKSGPDRIRLCQMCANQASALLIVPSVQWTVYTPVGLSQFEPFSIACHCAIVPWKLIVVKLMQL